MESTEINITQYCQIRNASIYLNGKIEYQFPTNLYEVFAENAYKFLDSKYPKFYKMDNLSKLGFLCSEVLLKNTNLKEYNSEKIGINIINKNSSIDTDIKYNNLISKGASSPAIFVYSLPNIMLGEICIRHNIKGENLLLVSDHYNIKMQFDYIQTLFKSDIVDAIICGFIDYIEEEYQAFLILVEKNNQTNSLPFTVENINQLYKP